MNKVASITITYNPDVNKLRAQLDGLAYCAICVIVDNGSELSVLEGVRALIEEGSNNVRLVELGANRGIAKAQNIGVIEALSVIRELDYFLFLDHDSIPEGNCVARLVYDYNTLLMEHTGLAAIGAMLIDPRTREEYGFHKYDFPFYRKIKKASTNELVTVCEYLNSSGTLISVHAWEKVGPYNEAMFIDFVDTEWCFRARSLGLSIYGSFSATMMHEIGDYNLRYWFFGWNTTPYRRPNRHFYIFRNAIFLFRQKYIPIWWKILCTLKMIWTISIFSIFSADRVTQIKYILRGIILGLKMNLDSKISHRPPS